MKSNNKIAVYTALVVLVSVLLASCGTPTPTPATVGSTGPLTLVASLTPDPTNYGTCDGHITTIRVTATGPASIIASMIISGPLYWTNPDGSHAGGAVDGFMTTFTRQADGSFLYTYDWSTGTGLSAPLVLWFQGTATDSTGATLATANLVSVSLNPCPGITSLSPLVHFPITLVAPSPHLTVNAILSPDPVYDGAGCTPHVADARVTLSGTFTSLVNNFDSGLGWTLPDGTPPAGANGVPLTLALQPDGSYTASYDFGLHPVGITTPYILTFVTTAVDSTGVALNKQAVVVQFLPCPGPVLPNINFPYHLARLEFDCLSLTSTLMIFTFDQSVSGSYHAMIGNQTWPCQLDAKNNMRLICTGPGLDQNVKAQVSLFDVLKPQTVLTQDTTTPICQLPTACPLTDGYCQTKYSSKAYQACPKTCTCEITCP
jgi:hypothetical protein